VKISGNFPSLTGNFHLLKLNDISIVSASATTKLAGAPLRLHEVNSLIMGENYIHKTSTPYTVDRPTPCIIDKNKLNRLFAVKINKISA
jgi:hypothetical protein